MARTSGARRRLRSVGSVVALLALVGAVTTTSVSAESNRPVEYLALGDSLAFGYNPLIPPTDPANFIGYPDIVAQALRADLTNASCPGETSSHFIALSGSDHGCGDFRGAGLPLHASYSGSQLEFVDAFLKAHPKTLVVTLDIGANDLGRLRDDCGGIANTTCILAGVPAMLATLTANLDTIYDHIRNIDGYHHKLVAMTFYSPNYSDLPMTGVIALVNQVLVERTLAWGGIVADGFGAFALASAPYGGDSCAAGLRIVKSTAPLSCDDHPSPAGRDLLAQAIVQALRAD